MLMPCQRAAAESRGKEPQISIQSKRRKKWEKEGMERKDNIEDESDHL